MSVFENPLPKAVIERGEHCLSSLASLLEKSQGVMPEGERVRCQLVHNRFLAVSVALRAEGKQTSVLNLLKHGEHRARTRLFERDCAHFYADVLIYVEALGRGSQISIYDVPFPAHSDRDVASHHLNNIAFLEEALNKYMGEPF